MSDARPAPATQGSCDQWCPRDGLLQEDADISATSKSSFLGMRKLAAVLFDEAHAEAWTIRPDVARAIQPSHPEDSSYARAAETLRGRDFAVTSHTDGPLDAAALAHADVLVIAHPS